MIIQTDARSILNGFFRHLRLFMLFFVPINLAAIIYLMAATPAYESTAKLLVKFGADVRPGVAESQNEGGPITADEEHDLVQSNVKILTSRDLAESLLNDTTLRTAYPQIAKNPPRHETPMDAAVKRYYDDLSVKTDNDSSAISVGLFNRDPAVAASMLRHLIDLFVARQSEIYSNPQTATLREQANEAYQKLQEADNQLNGYKEEAGVASIDQELSLLIQQRADIAGYMSRRPPESGSSSAPAGASSGAAPQQGSQVEALPARFPMSTGDRFPDLEDVQRKIDDLRAREAELLQTYNPDSDVIRNLRRNIGAEMASRNASVAALGRQIDDLDRQIADKNQRKAHYEELLRDDQLDEDNYKAAETRAQEAAAGQDLNQRKITQISVIEQPTVAYKPTRPHKLIVLTLCLLAGTALGFAACLAAQALDRSFSLPEEAAEGLGIPILASFSHASSGGRSLSRIQSFGRLT